MPFLPTFTHSTTHHILTGIFPTTYNPHWFQKKKKNILSSTVLENFKPLKFMVLTLEGVGFNQATFFSSRRSTCNQSGFKSGRLTFNEGRLAIRHRSLVAGHSWFRIFFPHSTRHVCSPIDIINHQIFLSTHVMTIAI